MSNLKEEWKTEEIKAEKTNQEKVMAYLNRQTTKPLVFISEYSSKEEIKITEIEKKTLWELLEEFLILSESNYSYCPETGNTETGKNKNRSSVDLWRHVIYYRPDVTIFDVLKTIHENRTKLGGQFCGNIKRQVFRLKSIRPEWTLLTGNITEYGIYFDDWGKL